MIGRAPRDVIHREGHLHRAVHMLLFDSQERVFVQKRSMSKDANPGLWDSSAAGHVDSGESPLAAAVRELEEELGIRLAKDELLHIGQLTPAPENGFEFVDMYRLRSDQSITLQADEVDEGRWVSEAELDRWIARSRADFTLIFHEILASARRVEGATGGTG